MDNNEFQEYVIDSEGVSTRETIEETTTAEELLIGCVQARPPLWDSRLPLRERGRTIRDNLWLEVYKEFGSNSDFPVEWLTKKWRNLRDTYVRLKGEYMPSGSAATKKKKWEFFDLLTFLNDCTNYRSTVSNLDPGPSTTPSPMSSPNLCTEETSKRKNSSSLPDVDLAIIGAINKINASPQPEFVPSVNPICQRISEMLNQMPQNERTKLEIKLLQVAYDGAKDFLK